MYAYTPRACIHAVNAPCLAYYVVMSHIWMNHVPHVNESFPTCEWAMSCRHRHWLSCPTYECVMSHTWTSHVLCLWMSDVSYPTYAAIANGDACRTCRIYMWDMTHSYLGHDSFRCAKWLIHAWDMTHLFSRHQQWSGITNGGTEHWGGLMSTIIYGTRLIHIWDVTHSCVGHDSFIQQASPMVVRSILEASCPTHTYECGHVPYINESCPKYGNKSCPAGIINGGTEHSWGPISRTHIPMRLCPIYGWVVSQICD